MFARAAKVRVRDEIWNEGKLFEKEVYISSDPEKLRKGVETPAVPKCDVITPAESVLCD